MSEVFNKIAEIEKAVEELKGLLAVKEFKTPVTDGSAPSTERPQPKSGTSVFSSEYKELVKGILTLAPGLSEIQIRKLADDEKAKAAGLLTEEACLHLVASNLGFEVDKGKVKKKLPPVEYTAPVMSELQGDGIDFTKVDYLNYGNTIRGKGYLEPKLWGQYNEILTAAGYRYSKEEKAWVFQPRDAKQEQSQPQKAAPAKDRSIKVVRISDLTQDTKSPTIEGKLLDDPIQRDIDTKRGPATVTNLRLDDGSAICRVSLWGELAEASMNLTAGTRVQITSLMVREPYDGMPQVSSGKWTKVIQL